MRNVAMRAASAHFSSSSRKGAHSPSPSAPRARPQWKGGYVRPMVRASISRSIAAKSSSSAPPSAGDDDFNKLHSALSRAIAEEDYSQAARIRDEITAKLEANGMDATNADWLALGLLPWLAERIVQLGYPIPTPIQRRVAPSVMIGSDVMVQATTGSGKTLAFLLPTLSTLDLDTPRDDIQSPMMVVIVPSKELGVQITMMIFKLFGGNVSKGIPGDPGNIFRYTGPKELKVRGILDAREAAMSRDPGFLKGVHVVVGTPEALDMAIADKLERETLEKALWYEQDPEVKEDVIRMGTTTPRSWVLDRVECIVVDEMDACFDRYPEETARVLMETHGDRLVKPQAVMCGATLSEEHVAKVAQTGILMAPVMCNVGEGKRLPGSIRHQHVVVKAPSKLMVLSRMLKEDLSTQDMDDAPPRAMVFASSDEEARAIADPLRTSLWGQHRLSVLLPTGFETVRQMEEFRDNRSTLMVCTPTSARGIDMPAVTHVYLTKCPADPSEYVHAAGRVGRVGAHVDGECVVLVAEGEEEREYLGMMARLGLETERIEAPKDATAGLDPEKADDLDTLKKAMEDLFILSEGDEEEPLS